MPPPEPVAKPLHFVKGRGAGSNDRSRFEAWQREPEVDNTPPADDSDTPAPPATTVTARLARSLISHNNSPDIPFDQSINAYQGCEHGCVYCYARPTHAYLGLSPGLDFERQVFYKANAVELLRAELGRRGYQPALIALGANTDPYQPAERQLRLTRDLLEVLSDCRLPVAITTKSALVTRDIDLLAPMAERGLLVVNISLGTLDHALARKMEPRANSPTRRLQAIRVLADAGIPVSIFSSPLIPAINDNHLERVLDAAAEAGARHASYTVLRLPLEVRDLVVQWLEHHFPLRAAHVMSLVRQMRGGRDYDPDFTTRMRGAGVYAQLIAQRFKVTTGRLGLTRPPTVWDTRQFRPPAAAPGQQALF